MRKHATKGFTLFEALLVLAIMTTIILAGIRLMEQKFDATRRARVVLQMQQILNAGLAFYVANARWPTSISELQGTYLPPTTVAFNNPWNKPFSISATSGGFYVYTNVLSGSTAGLVAGALPLSYVAAAPGSSTTPPTAAVCPPAATTCYTVAQVNIPGYNLNNASQVNFAGVYHSGACVPVPACPTDPQGNAMVPQIIVAPAAVNGLSDNPGSACSDNGDGTYTCTNANAHPIIGFTAAATAPGNNPIACSGSPANQTCEADSKTGALLTGGPYWRVCLSVTTDQPSGNVNPSNAPTQRDRIAWGQAYGTIFAFTRCAPQDEGSQSAAMNVWQP